MSKPELRWEWERKLSKHYAVGGFRIYQIHPSSGEYRATVIDGEVQPVGKEWFGSLRAAKAACERHWNES